MKKRYFIQRKIAVMLFLSCFYLYSSAIWVKTGPDGGAVYDMATNGTTIICSTDDGLYRSTDNGLNWIPSNDGLSLLNIGSIIYGNQTFILTNAMGTYNSPDGITWTNVSTQAYNGGLPLNINTGTSILGANTANSSVYRSTNNGTSWTIVPLKGTPNPKLMIYKSGTVYVPINNLIWYSTNDGLKWTAMSAGIALSGITITSTTMYAFGSINGVTGLYSIPASSTFYSPFTLVTTNLNLPANSSLTSLTDFNGKIYALLNNANTKLNTIISSTDGKIWNSTQGDLPLSTIFGLRVVNGDLYALSSKGLFSSSDNGVSWINKTKNIKSQTVTLLATSTNALYANLKPSIVSSSGGQAVWSIAALSKSINGGTTWTNTKLNDSIFVQNILTHNNDIFIIGHNLNILTNSSLLYRSTDNGDNWQVLGDMTQNVVSMVFALDKLYITTIDLFGTNLFSSVDNGTTFNPIMHNLPSVFGTTNVMASIGTDLYISPSLYVTSGGGVYKSSDGGVTWTTKNKYLANNMVVNKLQSSGSSLFAIANSTNLGYFNMSVDNAENWTYPAFDLPLEPVLSMFSAGNLLFMTTGIEQSNYGVDGGGIYMSTNNGFAWTNISENLPFVSMYSVAVKNNKVFLGTLGHGMWSRDLSELVNGFDKIKNENHLSVYPNPMQDNAMVKLDSQIQIKAAEFVIYDLSGATLKSTQVNSNEFEINRTGLANGLYIYKIITQDKIVGMGKLLLK
ncbi:MAG: T9SS type A sorting domain-containing protein [Paludibacter sp.]|nr:T9SS type A sorting domain-containing protein [Paludibacter sp.]